MTTTTEPPPSATVPTGPLPPIEHVAAPAWEPGPYRYISFSCLPCSFGAHYACFPARSRCQCPHD